TERIHGCGFCCQTTSRPGRKLFAEGCCLEGRRGEFSRRVLPSCRSGPFRNRRISPWVVRRYDRDLRVACRDCAHPEQGLSQQYGILTKGSCLEPRALFSLKKPFELPDQVTHERIASAALQGDEHHDRSRRVAGCRNDHDRAIAIQI